MQTERGDEPDNTLRQIQFMKNNYVPAGDMITIRWKQGVYVLEGAATQLERLAADQKTDEWFLEQLVRYAQQGRNLSDKSSAHNFAPKKLLEERGPDGKRVNKAVIKASMERLFATNKIHVEPYGAPSKGFSRLVAGPRQR